MATLSAAPAEIIIAIAECLSQCSHLAALALASNRMHMLVNPLLYASADEKTRTQVLFGAAYIGHARTVRFFLEAGVDPNETRMIAYRRLPKNLPPDLIAESHGESQGSNIPEDIIYYERPRSNTLNISQSNHLWHLGGIWSWTALHVAAREGHDTIVQLLLEHGAKSGTSSIQACRCGPPATLVSEQHTGARYPLWTALHLAICQGGDSTAKLLIARGASLQLDQNDDDPSPPYPGVRGITALHAAAQYGRIGVLEFLVDQGYQVDLEIRDGLGETPLDYAFMYNQPECFDFLLERGSRVNGFKEKVIARNEHLLYETCRIHLYDDAVQLVRYNLQVDPNWKVKVNKSKPLLHECLKYPEVDYYPSATKQAAFRVIRFLLRNGADIEERDSALNSTPLAAAIHTSYAFIADYLLAAGADANACDNNMQTPLLEACTKLDILLYSNIIQALLDKGARADVFDPKGQGPLHYLCALVPGSASKSERLRSSNMIELLIESGADPTARANVPHGPSTPLEQALSVDNFEAAETLLNYLPQPFSKGDLLGLFQTFIKTLSLKCLEWVLRLDKLDILLNDEQTILRLTRGNPKAMHAVDFLLDKGARCTGSSEMGDNAVYWALQYHWPLDSTKRLLEKGADSNAIRKQDSSNTCLLVKALQIKDRTKRRDFVKLLLQFGANVNLDIGPISLKRSIMRYINNQGELPRTPLHLMLMGWDYADDEITDMMLRATITGKYTEVQRRIYLEAVCSPISFEYVNVRALGILLQHGIPEIVAGGLLRTLLQQIERRQNVIDSWSSIAQMNDCINMLGLLVDHGASWEFTPLRVDSSGGIERSNGDILKDICNPQSPLKLADMGKLWCLKQRIVIIAGPAEGLRVEISPKRIEKYGLSTNICELGEILSKMEAGV